jgi:hypothetical protein
VGLSDDGHTGCGRQRNAMVDRHAGARIGLKSLSIHFEIVSYQRIHPEGDRRKQDSDNNLQLVPFASSQHERTIA